MKLIPLHDWAVIVPSEAEARTAGGLFIPDTAKEKPEEGVVEAIGPGAFEEEKRGKKKDEKKERKFIPTVVKPGDRVLYERWAGQTYKIGTEERILVRERSILGLIDRPQIPGVTTSREPTSIIERPVSKPPKTVEQGVSGTKVEAKARKTAAKPSAKKSLKKTSAKPIKKSTKKSTAKPAKAGASRGKKAGKKK